jgi:carboxymethylenebutenolidase
VYQFIRTIADRLAEAGYAAVAPDLFHRFTEEMVRSSGKSRRELLSDPQTIADINATVDWLRNHSAIDGERLGITGFCMGGREAWLGAATNPHIKAAVPYYGGNIQVPWGEATQSPFQLARNIKCPVLFHFGEIDVNPSQDDMRKYDAELTRRRISHQFYTYPNTDHGFMDFTAARYQKESAEASWPRTLEFLAQHLKGVPVGR